jgi:hypothetical protein
MNANWKNSALVTLTVLLVAALVAVCWQPAQAQREPGLPGAAPHYTVVELDPEAPVRTR